MSNKTFKLIMAMLVFLMGTADMQATNVTIPTTEGSYIDWNDAAHSGNGSVENDGKNVGSTKKNTVYTFTLENATVQDYVLTFAVGSQNAAKLLVTVTNTANNEVVLSKDVEVPNTGSWTPTVVNNFLLSQLPTGTYELKIKGNDDSNSGYFGNWGNLAVYAASNYDSTPGTLTLSKGSYNNNGMRVNGEEVGWIKNGSFATYSFINNTAGVYQMAMEISRSNVGNMNVKIVDGNSGATEVDYDYDIPASSYGTAQDILLPGKLTTGIKTLTLTFSSNHSNYICNYKAPTFTKQYDDLSTVSAVTIEGQTVTDGESSDWYCALPVSYDANTTFSVTAANGTVSVSAVDGNNAAVSVTDNGNGTYTIPTPSQAATTTVTATLTPNSGCYAPKTTYTFNIFRIGGISLTAVSVDGTTIDVLTDINNSAASYTATYGACYTTAPTVGATQIDGAAATVGAPVVSGTTYTYTIHGAIEGTDISRDYTLVLNNVHVYAAGANDESVVIKANEGTIANNTWTNGVYTLATTSLDSYNQFFKMNGDSYTLSVPADVVVKQIIMKDCSNNYAGNDARLTAVTSSGATAYIPVDNKYYHSSEGVQHDIIVNLDGHTAGSNIVLTQQKKGQPMAWIQLTIVKQNPGSAPQKIAENVTVRNNHAVVSVTFDREIVNDVQATINNQTVTAEGGAATLYFPVWDLNYSTDYTLAIAAGAATDAYNNSNADAINIAVSTSAKTAVTKAAYDYVVGTVEELQAAIAAVNSSNTSASAARKTIFIKNGEYNLGNYVGQGKSCTQLTGYNVSLIGQSRDGVIIHGDADGISNPVLNLRDRSGFYLQDLTVRNDRDFDNGLFNGGVAVAVYGGDKTIMKNVRMLSNQDTQVTGHRAYFEDCDIHGTVDFICGGGDNFYYHTGLVLEDRGGNCITAPSTNSSHRWGYVFQECTIKAADGATAAVDGSYSLGRPWQNEPRCTYLNTTMNVLPNNNGWGSMGTLPTHFYEYNSKDASGNAIDLSSRANSPTSTNHYSPVLTTAEAARYTVENVLGGTDSWLPTEECVTLPAPANLALTGTTLTWDEVADARLYVVFKNGVYVADIVANSYEVDDADAAYTVCAANERGGLGKVAASKTDTSDGETTAINTLIDGRTETATSGWYTLDGRRLSGKPAAKGIYINNGKKTVIKDANTGSGIHID